MANDKTLFEIQGKEGNDRRRVEDAMAWLLSSEAGDIGQELLQKAFAVRGHPIPILVTTARPSGFYHVTDESGIAINPTQIDRMLVKAKNGVSQAMSIERILAHELVHAGQPEATAEFQQHVIDMNNRAQEKALAEYSTEDRLKLAKHLESAKAAPDYDTARGHISVYVDEFTIPFQQKVNAHLLADPEYIEYLAKMEAPAIAVENKVAALRGEFQREDDYINSLQIDEAIRMSSIRELSDFLNISEKPQITDSPARSDGNTWEGSLGSRSGRKLGG